MTKPIPPLVVHTSNENMFFAMLNAQSKANAAVAQKNKAEAERDMAISRMYSTIEELRQKEAQRIRRNLFILKLAMFGLCAVGCVASAVFCIRNGLWWTTIAPLLTVVYSAFDLRHHGLR